MSDSLKALETWAEPLLARMAEGERRKLAGDIGRALRRSQHIRIQNQTDADGRTFLPRKAIRDQFGRIRKERGKLFRRITKAEFLKVTATADSVFVGFAGRVARIARVHQEGLVDSVRSGGPAIRYPQRQLIGITDADRDMIRNMLLQHLAAA